MGSSSPSKTSIMLVRYANYVEERHSSFLDEVYTRREEVISDSPFSNYTDVEVDNAFFGIGYVISSFPSLYDMFGKFMAGLDIDALYSQLFEDTLNSTEVDNLVSAEATLMEDDIEANVLPRLQTGIRDINSVMASTFVVGKTLIEDTRVKALEKFRAELKYKLIPTVRDRWISHLDWNKNIVSTYAELMKFYFSAKMDMDDINYSYSAKDKLWAFTVLEYERAAIAALQGATTTTTNVAGASTVSRVLGGALSGAAAGAMIGNAVAPAQAATATSAATAGGAGWGAGIGAALGIAAALTY